MAAATDMHEQPGRTALANLPARPAVGFFRRHLRGDYSLARSYWLHLVVFASLLPKLAALVLEPLCADRPARYAACATLLVLLSGWLAWIWAASGVYQSAQRHVARGGKAFWANFTKLMLALGLLGMLGNAIGMRAAFGDYVRTALGSQRGPATTFQLRADGRSLLLQGGINDDSAERLIQQLDAAPGVRTLVLHSNGGWVMQGRMLARIIAARGLDTYVEQDCSSACTIAFLAGRSRAADPVARIGFHAFHSMGSLSDRLTLSTDEKLARETYGKAGLPQQFINRIVATKPSDIWYPSHAEMLQAGVLTRISAGGETATVATLAVTRDKLEEEFKRSEVFDVLSVKYPADFKRIVDLAWRQVQAKTADREIIAAARAQLNQIRARLLPLASDKSLMDFQHLLLERAQALQPHSSAACVALIFPGDAASATASASAHIALPQEFIDRESHFTAALIRDSSPDNQRHFSQEETRQAIAYLLTSLTPAQHQLLRSPQQRAAAPEAACAMVISYLKALDTQPELLRKRTLRMLYSRN